MTAPPLRTALSDTYPAPSNATMRTGMGVFWDYVTGLLGSAGTPLAARAALGVGLTSRVKGLLGNVNAATPLTKFDLSADEVVLVDANGGTVRRTVTGTLTCDLGLAGSVANGRDQAAAFTANSWINVFVIWNGVTLATVSSIASHTVGPALPPGYTHCVYATTIRKDGSGNIIPVNVRGSDVFYDVADGGANRALSAGTATVMTTVSCAGLVPPAASSATLTFLLFCSHNAVLTFSLYARPNGSSHGGENVCRACVQVASVTSEAVNTRSFPLNSSAELQYKISAAPNIAGGAYVEVMGYTVPNGDC